MKADHPENRPAPPFFRYAVLAFTALLVLSLGFGLVPAAPPPAAEPPFPEQARAAALQETLRLRAAAVHLATPAAGAPVEPAVMEATVTLLTLQARALLSPSNPLSAARPTPPGSVPSAAEATAADSSLSGSLSRPEPGLPAATTAAPERVPTPGELASALSSSGVQRLTDAEKADGGMARLLAGAGTAQLLASETIAASVGVPGDALPHARQGTPATMQETNAPPADAAEASAMPTSCPSPLPGPAGTESAGGEPGQETTAGAPAGLESALSMAVAVEQQNVYAYQAALPRLAPDDATTAAAFLDQHQEVAAEASAHSRAACGDPDAQQPGYALGAEFFAAPTAGLARLELAALPAYGDVVSQADGDLRQWAIAALGEAARRVARWGGDPGPVPGILLDAGQLPKLPELSESTKPAATGAGS
ncbi:DUF4439 domain-containing protein [Pseudarthrobacter sp. NamE5]|uniref:DUF4439 domain-containing protein n=1 Tax=Pseudarthrobacter sp. NamE5 TaxID=2576839 RepID=UPI00110AA56D|nr:DUF4439 domain-containing protein [Pseudarthrobacter sp. NamE5]TLM85322.1 DUF4439 domain-containing protein [Pseudarthrobacter sp. NamE5]